jgi:H+/Cl- antiporter ClcA
MQQEVAMSEQAAETERARNALATMEIVGVILLIAGLIVGFAGHKTAQFGGADCGSVLAGGGGELTNTGFALCDKVMSAPTAWTFILLICAVLLLICGWIVDAVQESAHQAKLRNQAA